ncbi:MAG: VanW family protein, partial [Bacteroidota bacterium]
KNIISPLKRFTDHQQLIHHPVIAFSESDLWNPHDTADNWILTAGKIENLRVAAKELHGCEVKAGETFSFWQQVGKPSMRRGYVVGREIREGCIVPTVAGGLCQLSNALYDAALKANFTILERHKHTKVIKGSLAEQDRDATVKWNYLDLRFKATFDFRIEAKLTADKLLIMLKAAEKTFPAPQDFPALRTSNKLNDCYSCGNLACFKHPNKETLSPKMATTTFILDEQWPEFDHYLKTIVSDTDTCILPFKKGAFLPTTRYAWTSPKPHQTTSVLLPSLYRALKLRYAPKGKNNIFELCLQLDRKIAHAAARQVSIDTTHLVISQNLLPFVYETGVLGGRTYDVLVTRLPMEKLHERLDLAHTHQAGSTTLKDFRASKHLLDLENRALTQARKIITPHTEIAQFFKHKAVQLPWQLPTILPVQSRGQEILFPASTVGRKGAYEVRRLAKELQLDLTITGRLLEGEDFWKDIKVKRFNGDLTQIGLVIYPTYVEHQPRLILKALTAGIPVITTTACGLKSFENLKVLPLNRYDLLKHTCIETLQKHTVLTQE